MVQGCSQGRKRNYCLWISKLFFFFFRLESKAFLKVAGIRFPALNTQNQTALWALLHLKKAIDCSTLLSGLGPQSGHRCTPTHPEMHAKGISSESWVLIDLDTLKKVPMS